MWSNIKTPQSSIDALATIKEKKKEEEKNPPQFSQRKEGIQASMIHRDLQGGAAKPPSIIRLFVSVSWLLFRIVSILASGMNCKCGLHLLVRQQSEACRHRGRKGHSQSGGVSVNRVFNAFTPGQQDNTSLRPPSESMPYSRAAVLRVQCHSRQCHFEFLSSALPSGRAAPRSQMHHGLSVYACSAHRSVPSF